MLSVSSPSWVGSENEPIEPANSLPAADTYIIKLDYYVTRSIILEVLNNNNDDRMRVALLPITVHCVV